MSLVAMWHRAIAASGYMGSIKGMQEVRCPLYQYHAKHLSYIISLSCTLVAKDLAISMIESGILWHLLKSTYPKSICIEKLKKKQRYLINRLFIIPEDWKGERQISGRCKYPSTLSGDLF